MKFKNKQTGVVLEPKTDMVAEQLQKSPDYVPYDGKDDSENSGKALSRMNKAELLEAAQAAGVTVPDDATNAQIVELIKAATGQ